MRRRHIVLVAREWKPGALDDLFKNLEAPWASHHTNERGGNKMADQNTSIFKQVTGLSIGWGVVMILLGFLALALPLGTGVAVSEVTAWIVIFAGVAHFAAAFAGRSFGSVLWRLLIGAVYVIGGGYLASNPGLTLEALTAVMATIFTLEGVLEIARFFQFHAYSGSGWILFDGIITLALAYLIWRPWPNSSVWAIGTILGVNLMVSGFSVLMSSVTARKALQALGS
jgi:uncharacterized membrane protein HdeD (DUF308 family)